jgi:PAS domain S-box-containing protein
MKPSISKVKLFKKTDLFESLSESVIKQVLTDCKEILLTSGECLFKEGDSGDSMYLIYTGEIAIYKKGQLLATLGPGEYFGEMGMIHADTRAATAKAVGETHLVKIEKEKFYSKMANRPQSLNALLKTMARFSRDNLDSLVLNQNKFRSQVKLNAWLRELLDHAMDEIYVFDPVSYKIKHVNACVEKNLGYSLGEMTSKTPFDLLRDLTREKFDKLVQPLHAEDNVSISIEDHNLRKDGTFYSIEFNVRLHTIGDHSYFIAIVREKSETK